MRLKIFLFSMLCILGCTTPLPNPPNQGGLTWISTGSDENPAFLIACPNGKVIGSIVSEGPASHTWVAKTDTKWDVIDDLFNTGVGMYEIYASKDQASYAVVEDVMRRHLCGSSPTPKQEEPKHAPNL